jgi:tetratricopeptide (TPR) repeat protein
MNALAATYHAAGQLDKALPLFDETLRFRRARLGPANPETINSVTNLAVGYDDAGQLEKALPLYEEALQMTKARMQPHHPETLTAANRLAGAYREAGQFDKALPLYEDTLRLRKDHLGAHHPDTLVSMNNLALGYASAGQLDKALPLQEEALRLMRAHLGSDHVHTLTCANNLGLRYQDTGRLEQALALHEEAVIGIEQRRFQHEHAGRIVHHFTNVLEENKQFSKAESWRRKWLAVVKEKSGAESTSYADELASLGLNLLNQMKFLDADAVLRECLAVRQKAQADHWTTFNAQSMVGGALLGQGKYAEAEPLLIQGHAGMAEREHAIPVKSKVRLIESLERLVELYEAWGKPDEAARWRAELADRKAPELSPVK